MKILDLFCGIGGWSDPFVQDGDEVFGIDIKKIKRYTGTFIQADIRNISGHDFKNFDLIIGSPPCNEFSRARELGKNLKRNGPRNIEKGLELIREFERIVSQGQPKLWAMENVLPLYKHQWYTGKPILFFRISKQGYRVLYGNIPLTLDFYNVKFPNHRIDHKSDLQRAKIPYSVARYVANCVKTALTK